MSRALVAINDALQGAGIESILLGANIAKRCIFVNSREELPEQLRKMPQSSMLAIDLDFDEVRVFDSLSKARALCDLSRPGRTSVTLGMCVGADSPT
jgi:hypothetical protein